MPEAQGIDVWVADAGGARFSEYKITESRDDVTCYICCDAGAEFRPSFNVLDVPQSDLPLNFRLYIDGEQYSGKHAARRDRPSVCTGARTGDAREKPYTFAELQVADDADEVAELTERQAKGLGEIRVEVWRCRVVESQSDGRRRYSSEPAARPPRQYRTIGAVHESDKKAHVSHAAGLGTERVIEYPGGGGGGGRHRDDGRRRPPRVERRHRDVGDRPILTFRFLYRSRELLEALNVIERPSVAPAPPSSDPLRAETVKPGALDVKPAAEIIDVDLAIASTASGAARPYAHVAFRVLDDQTIDLT